MAKPKAPRPDIGHRVAALMRASDDCKTQEALAKKSGVAQSTIGRILLGETNPSIGVVQKLATALGSTVEYLTTGNGPRSPALPSDDVKTQSGRASQYARTDPDMLVAADEELRLLERTEGVVYEPEARLRRLSELYNLAIEDGGKLSTTRLKLLMEEALQRRDGALKNERSAGHHGKSGAGKGKR